MAEYNNITGALETTFYTSVDNAIKSSEEIIPGLIAASIIIFIGWILSILISEIFKRFLSFIKLEEYLKSYKVEDALGKVRISDILTKLLKYYLLVGFIQQAFELVKFGVISGFLGFVIFNLPIIIAAILVIVVAAIIGEYVKHTVMDLNEKSASVKLIAKGSKIIIVIIGIIMGLSTANFETSLISGIVMIVLQALVFGIALAVGLAFGLGGQKDASELIGKWRKNLKI